MNRSGRNVNGDGQKAESVDNGMLQSIFIRRKLRVTYILKEQMDVREVTMCNQL